MSNEPASGMIPRADDETLRVSNHLTPEQFTKCWKTDEPATDVADMSGERMQTLSQTCMSVA